MTACVLPQNQEVKDVLRFGSRQVEVGVEPARRRPGAAGQREQDHPGREDGPPSVEAETARRRSSGGWAETGAKDMGGSLECRRVRQT